MLKYKIPQIVTLTHGSFCCLACCVFPVKHKSYCWVLHNLKDLVSHKGITFVAHFMKYNEI